jgi:outer membrane lipoprotein carrier protein
MVRHLYSIPLMFSLVGSMSANQLTARFEERYRTAKTLQATFLERYSEGGRVVRSEAGIAYFQRPGKMRWEYERPERDLFLVDGKTAWFYVPADHTVTRVPAKQSGDWRTPLALLAGRMKVSRLCSRVEIAEGEKALREDDMVLRCHVHGQDQDAANTLDQQSVLGVGKSDAVFFEVARDSGELARLIVRQAGGIEVEFRFENWRFYPALPDAMFHFDPPPGVAIVNGELADGKI